MSKKPVVIYGASGYTGRLVAEFMRHYGIPFIAAGRNEERIKEAMALVPGIETADYEVVAVEHTVEALTELFSGTQVVCNTVGPFLYYGMDVVEACARAKVHYLDTGGEPAIISKMKAQYDEVYKENGKVLAPSTAYMYTVLEIAARKVLETPGIDSLQCVCSPTGIPTYGSTQTVFAMFSSADEAYRLENNELVNWSPAKSYEVKMPGQVDTLLTHPWGGGTLPLYFQDDPRVRNVRQLTGFTDREMMKGIIGLQQVYEADIKHLPEAEQIAALKAMGDNMTAGMPPRENPLIHRCTDVAYGRGGNKSVGCVIRSLVAYQTTGLLQAATANFLIGGHQLTSGFASACEAVGHDELYGQITNFGFATMELTQEAHGNI